MKPVSPTLVSTRYGYVLPGNDPGPVVRSLSLYGEWAEQETELLAGLLEEGQTVLEVGGQWGAHALWMARAVGPQGSVHVAEPDRLHVQQLCANVALNGLTQVFTHHVELGDTTASAAPLAAQGPGERARRCTVDTLDLPALHLLKVNLTHTLPDLLAGAADTVRRHRPFIYARLSGLEQAEAEVRALKDAGYRVWSHAPYLFNADNHAGAHNNIFPGVLQQNVLAAPADGAFRLDGRLEL